MLVAIAVAYGAVLIAAAPADAKLGLFRARRTWWWTQSPSGWEGRKIWPNGAATVRPNLATGDTFPSKHATATIGTSPFDSPATPNPSFNIPQSLIKDTTYFWSCPTPGPPPFDCYEGYLIAQYQYSYWNGAAHFQKNHSQAAATTTTVRRRTIMDGGGLKGTYGPPTVYTPTVMFTLVTPTEGGCNVDDEGINHPQDCPGTTEFDGDYTESRGGSFKIIPGGNKFGGSLRWFGGPNGFSYVRISYFTPIWFRSTGMYRPYNQQPTAMVPKEIGYVEHTGSGHRFRLTNPAHVLVDLLGTTTEGAGDKNCADFTVFPPASQQAYTAKGAPGGNNTPTDAGCAYYIKTENAVRTGAPYTTGTIVNWEPNGNYSSKFTTTGSDVRTNLGLNGTISLVSPRLLHLYTRDPDSVGGDVNLTWSSARPRKMVFTFVPEPVAVTMLAAGFVAVVGLHRLRRR